MDVPLDRAPRLLVQIEARRVDYQRVAPARFLPSRADFQICLD